MPASPMVVAAYLTAAAEEGKVDGRPRFGSASFTRWASSINQIHTAGGFPAPGRSEVVRRALAGVRRTRKAPPKRRSPLLLADVRTLLEQMRPSVFVWLAAMAAHRDATLLLMGFVGAYRRSEFTALRIDGAPGVRAARPGPVVQNRPEGQGAVRALPYVVESAGNPVLCGPARWCGRAAPSTPRSV